ncbi:LysM peptidoglycan-binding domain-containing protein [Pleurocapsa sp. PCC 7319]|uniref:LysM peptidoglycan-binding domain-containing protein n=1 Tax=Pleurocapsa sp. PCC 7319 TaxID=118161 RepID=UPI000345C5B9|nr:LysM domain-containing protein [Pleurocapsa sp. PCC 7319]
MSNAPILYQVEHTVKPGETLCTIALRYYGDESRWRDIYKVTMMQQELLQQEDFEPHNMPAGIVVVVPYPTQGLD